MATFDELFQTAPAPAAPPPPSGGTFASMFGEAPPVVKTAEPQALQESLDLETGMKSKFKPRRSLTEVVEGRPQPGAPGEEPEGFTDNLKNPFELWRGSLVGNLRRAAQRGTFGKDFSELVNTNIDNLKHFDMGEFAEQIKKDPGKVGAEFFNALVQDPYLILAPAGLGGAVAGRLGMVGAKVGPKAAAAGKIGGRVGEAAVMGSAQNVAIEAGRQLDETGQIELASLAAPAEAGAALTALLATPLAIVAGRTRRPPKQAAPDEIASLSKMLYEAEGLDKPAKPHIRAKSSPDQIGATVEAPALPSRGDKAAMWQWAQDNGISVTDAYKSVSKLKAIEAERAALGESALPEGVTERRAGQRMPNEGALRKQLEEVNAQRTTILDDPAKGEELAVLGERASRVNNQLAELGRNSKRAEEVLREFGYGRGKGQRGAVGDLNSLQYDARSVAEVMLTEMGGPDRSKWTSATYKNAGDYAEMKARTASPKMKEKYVEASRQLRAAMAGGTADPFRGPGRGQAGAVKLPGGMWHPEAVERLSAPLWQGLGPRNREIRQIAGESQADYLARAKEANKEQVAVEQWADSRIKTYLNRYAGTERDPLKDIEIPFGEGTRRWEEITDQAIRSRQARAAFAGNRGEVNPANEATIQRNPNEPIWEIINQPATNEFGRAKHALESYLSHVGDYLRQNVAPDKLPQYDLVRAVKETAAADARAAKEMEKAAASSMKDMPVYKEYPDGMKWVELRLPEKLTLEQMKAVRLATKDEIRQIGKAAIAEGEISSIQEVGAPYVAVDASGKPIKNSYTNQIVAAGDPENAHLAGQLAQEGNQMGHCVGGYCEGVTSGESKIYSLRDKKGRSHVTVEATPQVKSLSEEVTSTTPWDIAQIKGRQNRAPAAEYLPYVQDFVKSGKWGEVGDLEGTGLREIDWSSWRAREPEFVAKASETFDTNARFVAASELERLDQLWQEHTQGRSTFAREETAAAGQAMRDLQARNGPGHNQRGETDVRLLAGVGLAGAGALAGAILSDNEPIRSALQGAAAAGILPWIRPILNRMAAGGDASLGILSTQINNLTTTDGTYLGPILKLARNYEHHTARDSVAALVQAAPFIKAYNKLDTATKGALTDAAYSSNFGEAVRILTATKNPNLIKGWLEMRKVDEGLGKTLTEMGRIRPIKNHFPRSVKDLPGLLKELGHEHATRLETAIADAEASAMRTYGQGLSTAERDTVINNFLDRGMREGSGQPGAYKAREIAEITERLRPYYYDLGTSFQRYVHSVIPDIEMARFFGRDLVESSKDGLTYTNTSASIGNLVGRELEAGRLSQQQAVELEKLLQLWAKNRVATTPAIQAIRNIAYAGLLPNLSSAGVQLTDLPMVAYKAGIVPTAQAVIRGLTGKWDVNIEKLGIANRILPDLIGEVELPPARSEGERLAQQAAVYTAKFLNISMIGAAFSAMDRFSKGISANAPLIRMQKLAQTQKGVEEITRKYGLAFGEYLPQLLDDLKARRPSELVDALAFNELSDLQPISRLEKPSGALELQGTPMRDTFGLVYVLKNWMARQMDIGRRDIYNEIKAGHYQRGLTNMFKYGLALYAMNISAQAIRDWTLGREVNLDDIEVSNAFKTFGWSNYVEDKLKEGKVTEALGVAIAPPYQMFDEILRLDPKAVKYIPWVGKQYESREMGGAERYDEAKRKRKVAERNEEVRELMRSAR